MNFAPLFNKRVPHIRFSMLRTRFFVWHKIPLRKIRFSLMALPPLLSLRSVGCPSGFTAPSRHSANKFALCSRFNRSGPFSHSKRNSKNFPSFPLSALILLRRLFLLAARHSANKFALCTRSAASGPFSYSKRKLKNFPSFPLSAFRFPFYFVSLGEI